MSWQLPAECQVYTFKLTLCKIAFGTRKGLPFLLLRLQHTVKDHIVEY